MTLMNSFVSMGMMPYDILPFYRILPSSVDPRGRQGRTPPGFKFFHFQAVFFTKNPQNRLANPLWELAPLQKNPGSATDGVL